MPPPQAGAEVLRFVFESEVRNPTALTAGLLYEIGTFGTTMRFNVPLNDQLAVSDSGSPETEPVWQHYLSIWTCWNHVRTLAAILSPCG